MTENTKYFIGIDLHKSITQVCVLDRGGDVLEERRFVGGSARATTKRRIGPEQRSSSSAIKEVPKPGARSPS